MVQKSQHSQGSETHFISQRSRRFQYPHYALLVPLFGFFNAFLCHNWRNAPSWNQNLRQGTRYSRTIVRKPNRPTKSIANPYSRMERRIGPSTEDITTRLLHIKYTDNANVSYSDEGNEAVRDEIRALREEVTILRRTNARNQNQSAENNRVSEPTAPLVVSPSQDPIFPARGSTFSLRISSADHDGELRPRVSTTILLPSGVRSVPRAATPAELRPISSPMTRQTPTQTDRYETRETPRPRHILPSTSRRPKTPWPW